MIVPNVGEPHLRVFQIQRAGEKQTWPNGHVTWAVHFEEAIDVLPDWGQPGEHSCQLWLQMLRLQLQLKEATTQETAKESLNRLHVVCSEHLSNKKMCLNKVLDLISTLNLPNGNCDAAADW